MSSLPLVCVCVPTYNAGKTIRKTLLSLLAQDYDHFEIHVVDNASTDDTLAVVEALTCECLYVHKHDINVGGEGNFNRCIQLARGTYTAIFHADDVYEPNMLSEQVSYLEAHLTAAAVFTEASLIDKNDRVFGAIKFPRDVRSSDGLCDFKTLFKAILRHSNFLICPSVMARTPVYKDEIRAWRGELFHTSADLDVWLRMAQNHLIGLLAQPLMRYRISSDHGSAQVRLKIDRADFFTVIDHYLGKQDVSIQLTTVDMQNYACLERRDKAMRAANALLQDQQKLARMLCSEVLSWRCFVDAFKSKRGLLVLVLASFVQLLLLIGAPKPAKIWLMKLKQTFSK